MQLNSLAEGQVCHQARGRARHSQGWVGSSKFMGHLFHNLALTYGSRKRDFSSKMHFVSESQRMLRPWFMRCFLLNASLNSVSKETMRPEASLRSHPHLPALREEPGEGKWPRGTVLRCGPVAASCPCLHRGVGRADGDGWGRP